MQFKQRTDFAIDLPSWELQAEQYDRQLKKTSTRIALVLLMQMVGFRVFAVVISVVKALLDWMLPVAASHILGQGLYGLGYFVVFTLPAWVFWKLSKKQGDKCRPIDRERLPRTSVWIVFAVVTLNFAAAYVNNFALTMFFPSFESLVSAMQDDAVLWYEVVMSIFTVAVVPAICEEILFRGVIAHALVPYGRTVAILGSALLFGLMHGNPLQIFYTSLMGVALGYVYVKTRSLCLCMLIHFVNNLISVVQSTLSNLGEWSTALIGGIELTVIVMGTVSMGILLARAAKIKNPEETGSFGVVFEPQADYAERPVTPRKRVALFFAPLMIVYVILSILAMMGISWRFWFPVFF